MANNTHYIDNSLTDSFNPFEDTNHSLYGTKDEDLTQEQIDYIETEKYYDKKQQDINTFLK